MTLETWLPLLDALLILASGISLVVGFVLIKRGRVAAHKRAMLSATVLAALFLIVYVLRQFLIETKLFPDEGLIRTLYFAVLVPHVILAIAIVPLVLLVLRRAFKGEFERHKRLARITFPIWLFVAISGWAVYWMLHHL